MNRERLPAKICESCPTAVHYFDEGYVGKQPVASKTNIVRGTGYKKYRKDIDRCTYRRDITEMMLK